MKRYAMAAAIPLLVLATSVRAECMAPPDLQEGKSPHGLLGIRIASGGALNRPADGQFAKAEWYHLGSHPPKILHTTALLHPTAPIDFRITDDGWLVTIEDWCRYGRGNVLVIYSSMGDVVRKYALADLYSPADISRFGFGGEGIVWRCYGSSSLALTQNNELSLVDALGGRFVFTLATGAFTYERGADTCVGK